MKENTSGAIDDLFAKIRLKLLKLREYDPSTIDDLKSLLIQLEDCVEKLVVDSLKLESLERRLKRATKPEKKLKKRPVRK